ncbi:MAG: hypothetical protein AAB515_00270 [Patescibacteria group bacterium]
MASTKIGDTREQETLRVIADITIKLANGSLTLESAKRFAKKESPFTMPQKLSVDGSEPRFQSISKDAYYYVNPNLKIEHFPLTNPAVRDVEYEIVEFNHDPTTQEILDACETGTLRRPERDEAEIYFDNVPDSRDQLGKSPIVALCGSLLELEGYRCVAYAELNDFGRNLGLRGFGDRWFGQCRFLAVRKFAL